MRSKPLRASVPGIPAPLHVDRRTLLQALASLGALSAAGCGGLIKPPVIRPPLSPDYTVDIHAHVHNATDLSVKGFAERVVFERFEDVHCYKVTEAPGGVFDDLVSILVNLLSKGAMSATEELAEIGNSAASHAAAASPPGRVRRAAWKSTRANISSQIDPGDRSDAEILAEVLREAEQDRAGALRGPAAPGGSTVVNALREETGVTAERGKDTADELARKTVEGKGPIGAIIRWALLLLKPRRYIISRYLETYARQDGGVHLFTPFLVDFEYWVDDKPKSPLADQVAVMDRLQRWVAEVTGGARMHSFVPFCPWRDIAENGAPFELVQDAIMERGFVGVKIYPAMGYYPSGNADQPPGDACYPGRTQNWGRNFPRLLDRSLHRLYDWCAAQGVPIITHSNDSQGAGASFAKRSHPKYWRDIVSSSRYRGLRINMGHFGDFQESFYEPAGTPWEQTIGEFIQGADGTGADVYADLSYLSEMFNPYDKAAITERLNTFLEAYPKSIDRLMFGTDWVLVGKEREHETYLETFRSLLTDLNPPHADPDKIMHHNAMRFLGLISSESKSYARLQQYYQKYGLDAGWLDGRWGSVTA